uniref:ATP synthase F0 subunit 8 n=1 Tax=Chloriona tateyamana TaxID=2566016 RepID=A0A7S5DBP2_9HEMI|nr:ATP synthase F0 subunit 8 [Chloriona tateyamana]QBZ37981.1 ATP synthase F0 subunit 8 [Chloriona tateyamana]
MPQMSPYSWITLLILSNMLVQLTKTSLFFEKKY